MKTTQIGTLVTVYFRDRPAAYFDIASDRLHLNTDFDLAMSEGDELVTWVRQIRALLTLHKTSDEMKTTQGDSLTIAYIRDRPTAYFFNYDGSSWLNPYVELTPDECKEIQNWLIQARALFRLTRRLTQ